VSLSHGSVLAREYGLSLESVEIQYGVFGVLRYHTFGVVSSIFI
jgi:hypothetical protein